MRTAMSARAIGYPLIITVIVSMVLLNPTHADQDELVVALSHWPPMKINNPEFGGIDFLILREIEERIDTKISFLACPWLRCIDMIIKGDADIVTSFELIKGREEYAIFIEPSYIQVKNRLYKNKDTQVTVSKYEDLYDYIIGAIKGGVYFPRFDNDNSLNIERLSKEIQQLRMLKGQRVDVIIGSEYNLDYLIAKNNLHGIIEKLPLEIPPKQKAFFAISKKSKHVSLIPKIEPILREMVETKQIETIIDNYFRDIQVGE